MLPTSPGALDLSLPGNATLNLQLTYKDAAGAVVDLAGYHARMRAVDGAGSQVLALSDAGGGGITLTTGGVAPNITLAAPAATMEAMGAVAGKYDLVLVDPSGNQAPLVGGAFIVTPGVTP